MAYRVLGVGNYKGGVGKTFVSKILAEYFAIIKELRVLLIDLDPQTNLSRRYLDMVVLDDGSQEYAPPVHPDYDPSDPEDADWGGRSDSADIWLSAFAVPYPTKYQGLDILPAHSKKLQRIELVREQEVFDQVSRRLRDYVHLPDLQDEYDLVILDTRPSKGPLVQAAMHAATHLIIPSEMESPSVEGLHGMMSVRTHENLHRPRGQELELIGILPNKIRTNTTIHREYLAMLREDPDMAPYMLPVQINDWVEYKSSMIYSPADEAPDSFFLRGENDRFRQQLCEVGEVVAQRLYGATPRVSRQESGRTLV
jgi:chromosome partitioning protein